MDDPNQTPPGRPLAGQFALVTGASSGIGRAVAIELARNGADVAVNYSRSEGAAREVAEACRAFGVRALTAQADVGNEREVQQMFAQCVAELGTLDILVNNAGLQADAPIEEMSLAQWQRVIDVNLTGQFLCAREAVREFTRRGMREVSVALGKILCISSVHDVIPWAGHVNYAASKGGTNLLMRSLAQELAPRRVRVNSVCPGAVRTPINRAAWSTPEAYEALMKLVPYKRIGEPEDIARAVAWLCSDAADYVTGASLYVDGGMTLYPGFEDGG